MQGPPMPIMPNNCGGEIAKPELITVRLENEIHTVYEKVSNLKAKIEEIVNSMVGKFNETKKDTGNTIKVSTPDGDINKARACLKDIIIRIDSINCSLQRLNISTGEK